MIKEDEGLRADARANRDRILNLARSAFAADPQASLNSIAKMAGVGAGTLYRHFPSRDALILAVYRKEIEALVNLAPALTAEHTPLDAFRLWCERLAEYGRIKHGLAGVIHTMLTVRDHEETYWPMVGAVGHLLKACVASGEFHDGIDPEDVLLILGFLWRTKPGEAGKAQARTLLALVIEGLRKR